MQTLAATEVEQWVVEQAAAATWSGEEQRRICCRVELDCYWLAEGRRDLFDFELLLASRQGKPLPLEVSFTPQDSATPIRFRLDQPLRLSPEFIAKPWGQEIWYTGVEQRGVCRVQAEQGGSIPLPWLLETLSPWLSGGRRELVLLKILDPLAAEVWGDLYFELHEEKREVYVVTRVDPSAWPDGAGAIRFGFDPRRRAAFDSDADFRAAYRASVSAYEGVRRAIDELLDEKRKIQGIALNEPVAAEQIQRWQRELPAVLLEQERCLRAEMDAFSRLLPLRVGDVVKVPCYTPHALQHGVRTVEFQTPVYERKILSFAQKVLTQNQWDTDEAVKLMALEPEPERPFAVCHRGEGVLVERIVDFDDFQVERWCLEPGRAHGLQLHGGYVLVMSIDGDATVAGIRLGPEQACLLPASSADAILAQQGEKAATLLVARPA